MTDDAAAVTAREIAEAVMAACDKHGPIAPRYGAEIIEPIINSALATARAEERERWNEAVEKFLASQTLERLDVQRASATRAARVMARALRAGA